MLWLVALCLVGTFVNVGCWSSGEEEDYVSLDCLPEICDFYDEVQDKAPEDCGAFGKDTDVQTANHQVADTVQGASTTTSLPPSQALVDKIPALQEDGLHSGLRSSSVHVRQPSVDTEKFFSHLLEENNLESKLSTSNDRKAFITKDSPSIAHMRRERRGEKKKPKSIRNSPTYTAYLGEKLEFETSTKQSAQVAHVLTCSPDFNRGPNYAIQSYEAFDIVVRPHQLAVLAELKNSPHRSGLLASLSRLDQSPPGRLAKSTSALFSWTKGGMIALLRQGQLHLWTEGEQSHRLYLFRGETIKELCGQAVEKIENNDILALVSAKIESSQMSLLYSSTDRTMVSLGSALHRFLHPRRRDAGTILKTEQDFVILDLAIHS
jgi:hypothetical protein